MKRYLVAVCLLTVLAGIVSSFDCKAQEPVPAVVVESVANAECDICVRRRGIFNRGVINRNIVSKTSMQEYTVERPVMETVVVQQPVSETYMQVTRQRRVRKKPVRSFFRRIFCR